MVSKKNLAQANGNVIFQTALDVQETDDEGLDKTASKECGPYDHAW